MMTGWEYKSGSLFVDDGISAEAVKADRELYQISLLEARARQRKASMRQRLMYAVEHEDLSPVTAEILADLAGVTL